MDPLAVLARLARQARDEERQRVLETEEAIAARCDQLARLHEAAEREQRAACGLTDGTVRLMAYLRGVAARARALQAELHRLKQRREAQSVRLAERQVELRRLERLLERRAERARLEHLRREQKALDELVLLRPQRRASR